MVGHAFLRDHNLFYVFVVITTYIPLEIKSKES